MRPLFSPLTKTGQNRIMRNKPVSSFYLISFFIASLLSICLPLSAAGQAYVGNPKLIVIVSSISFAATTLSAIAPSSRAAASIFS